jgi:hypothetical protein
MRAPDELLGRRDDSRYRPLPLDLKPRQRGERIVRIASISSPSRPCRAGELHRQRSARRFDEARDRAGDRHRVRIGDRELHRRRATS